MYLPFNAAFLTEPGMGLAWWEKGTGASGGVDLAKEK